MVYWVETLPTGQAADWIRLRLEGAKLFPLGFLITANEAAKMTLERAGKILDFGATRGLFSEGHLVGFAGFKAQILSRIRHRAEIGPFCITPDHHDTGAEQRLMSATIAEARATGLELLELFVDAENTRAIRFYENVGFDYVATRRDQVRIDGMSRDDHFYNL